MDMIATAGPVLEVIEGGRGRPEQITQRRTSALAPVMEGIALADDVRAAAERIYLALSTGALETAAREAGRIHSRATACREELRSFAGALETEA